AEGNVSFGAHHAGNLVKSVRDDLSYLIMVCNPDHGNQIDGAGYGVDLTYAAECGDLLSHLGDSSYLGFDEDNRSEHGGHLNVQGGQKPSRAISPAERVVDQRFMVQHSMQRPHPVAGDVDQANARLLEPIRDPLRLFDAGCRQRIRWLRHGLSCSPYRTRNRLRHILTARKARPGQPTVTDDMDLPVKINSSGGHDLRAGSEAPDAVEARRRTGQSLQPAADDLSLLEPLLTDQSPQPCLNAENGRSGVHRQGGAYRFHNLAIAVSGDGAVTG